MSRKSKYTRRRAIECKIVEKSKNNPGYLKYMVTIAEMDGTIHKQPCYGKDMQDALSRLINQERTIMVEKRVERNPLILLFGFLTIMIGPILITDLSNTPWFILYLFGSFATLFVLAGWWQHYLDKK